MPEPIRDFFDQRSHHRDEVIAGNLIIDYEQRTRAAAVMNLLQPKSGEAILDVGCGNGRDLRALVAMGCRCVGLDYSPGMIAEARAALGDAVELVVGDATRLPFDDARFDKVFASEVIEHIPDWHRAIAEMARVLKPGGTLVLTTPNRRSWYGFDRFILEKLFRRKWSHPFDQWKTSRQVIAACEAVGLAIRRTVGICYVPGFALTYRAPRFLQRAVLALTTALEPLLARTLPGRGYMIGVMASRC